MLLFTKILAFDPGECTGWAEVWNTLDRSTSMRANNKRSPIKTPYGYIVDYGDFPLWDSVEELTLGLAPDHIVVESFRLYPGKAAALSYSTLPTVEVIGVIKFLGNKHGTEVIEQSASEMKSHRVYQHVLKPFSRKDCHAYDAACHALVFSCKNNIEVA